MILRPCNFEKTTQEASRHVTHWRVTTTVRESSQSFEIKVSIMVNFKTAFGIIALMGLLVLAEPKEERTLIIGGGVAGIHMGYRLQQRGQPTEIWEMTDQLGGKARLLYEKEGATMDAGAILFPTSTWQ